MAIDSGSMKKRVTLQRASTERDETGQVVETPYTTLGKSFCSIGPVSGREYFAASGEHSDVTHKIRMRARTDFTLRPSDRILYGSRAFDIQSVLDEVEDGRLWLIMATEQIDGA